MAWDSIADLATVACRDLYGSTATYTPISTGVAETLVAVLDRLPESVPVPGDDALSTQLPRLDVRLADLTVAPARGDTVAVGGSTWEVHDVRLDGRGSALLGLVEVPS